MASRFMDEHDKASFTDIAPDFDRLFDDVNHLINLEGEALDTILRKHTIHSVLDVACGTGIQSIGLARRGYQVYASDISPRMVRTTRHKAMAENLAIDVRCADFRTLTPWCGQQFDAIISGGNSLPLLKRDEDIERSLHCMLERLKKPGGVGVIGIHHYGLLEQHGKSLLIRRVQTDEISAELLLDVRQFGFQRTRVSYLYLYSQDRRWRMKVYTKSYLNLSPEDLACRMEQVGFTNVHLYDVSGQRSWNPADEWALAVGIS